MIKTIRLTSIIVSSLLMTNMAFGQNTLKDYFDLVIAADSLYEAKKYRKSGEKYTEAFKIPTLKPYPEDRYNAACSWALAGVKDSAFFHLYTIAKKYDFADYDHTSTDPDLVSLYKDLRWKPLLSIIKENKEKAEVNFNRPLIAALDTIYTEDQQHRKQISDLEKAHGRESKEMAALWKTITEKDSLNLIKVKGILDQYGWLGQDIVGEQGNTTLFLVIQHADQATQEKYLPMMREAVKSGKARGSHLALLEDRVALGQGKRQIYGSQIGRDPDTNVFYVLPLEDPDNVDKRRAEVGLGPILDYVGQWQIIWNVEEYKKELPKIEEKNKRKN